jgi:opacity protein-like surface antigen
MNDGRSGRREQRVAFLMTRLSLPLILIGLAASPLFSAAAHAQDDDKGIYAVARAGMAVDPQQKIGSADDIVSAFDDKTKYKSGITGQIGAGYDFGMFRVEQTVGYTNLKAKGLDQDGFTGEGRNKAMSMTVAGYIDIPVSSFIIPYVGGGVGVTRVDARLSRTDDLTGIASSYSGKDWGMMWHADAGVGIRVAPKVMLEVGGRYSQASGLKFDGVSNGQDTVFKPKMRTLSGTLGVRYMF